MSEYNFKEKEFKGRLLQVFMTAAVFIALIIFAEGVAAQAAEAGSVEVKSIDYSTSTLTVKLNSGDTRLYLSNAAQKKWEYVPAVIKDINGEKLAVIDISWISTSTAYTLSFKADVSTKPVSVVIPKMETNMKVTYNMATGTVTFTNAGSDAIEWKKKDGMYWTEYNAASFADELSTFIDNGASLIFRKKGTNGTSASNPGRRPGKEVTLNIPKKTAAPDISINDDKLTIAVKKGWMYRQVDSEGKAAGEWTEITSNREVPLAEIAPQAMYTGSKAGEDVYVQFCRKATASSQVSRYKTILIPGQTDLTSNDLSAASIEYTSSSSFKLTFDTAGDSNVLEYCILTASMQKLGIRIDDLQSGHLTWNTVSSSSPVSKSLSSDSSLENGSIIYFRKKAVKSLGDDEYALASPAHQLATVSYPQGAITENFTLLQTVEGMCRDGSNTLEFSFYSDTNGSIDSIEFKTAGGASSKGKATFKTSISESNLGDPSKKYIYNVTITDLSNVTATRTKLYAYISMKGESSPSIKSTDSAGIGLYIYPKSVISNPVSSTDKNEVAQNLGWNDYEPANDRIGFTSKIERVFMSDRSEEAYAAGGLSSADMIDQSDFRVKLDIGTYLNPDLNADSTEKYLSEAVTVTKLKYDGVEISGSEYFEVEYYTDENDDITDASLDKRYRVAVITLHADRIETLSGIDDRDKDTPVQIYLSNGEVLTSGLTMNLQRTATAAPTSYTVTAGNLEAWTVTKVTDSNGNVTETKTRNLDSYMKFTLTVPAKLGGKSDYAAGIRSVTWNSTNILYETQTSGKNITVVLDSDLLNQITGISTSVTRDIRIEFTNGYVITSGISLTINPAGTK